MKSNFYKRPFTRIAMAFMAVGLSVAALSADGTDPVDKYTLTSTDPADNSTVEKFKTIKAVWQTPAGATNMIRATYNQAKTQVKVTNEAGDSITNGRMTGSVAAGVTISLSKEISEPGKYTVTVKANTIYLGDYANMDNMGKPAPVEGSGNDEVQIHYTILPKNYVLESTDPADNSTVEKFKTIKAVWQTPAGATDMIRAAYNQSKTQVKVTNEAGDSITNGRMTGSVQSGVTISLSKEIKDPGKYTVTVKANTIYLGDYANMDNMGKPAPVEGSGNDEVQIHYTILPKNYVLESTDPADNSTVEKFKNISVVWQTPAGATDKIRATYNTSKSQILVTNAAGDSITNGRMVGIASMGVKIQLSKEISEPGQYTVTVKPNTIYLGDYDQMDNMGKPAPVEGTGNDEVQLHYTVAPSKYVLESADPADNSTVEKFKVISVVWRAPAGATDKIRATYNTSKSQILVTNAAGDSITNGRMIGFASMGVNIQLSEEISEPGQYTVTVKPNTIYLGDYDQMDNMGKPAPVDGTGNDEVQLHYTVEAPVPPMDPVAFVSAEPADSAVVETLELITTTWSGVPEEGDIQLACSKGAGAVTVADASGNSACDAALTISDGKVVVNLSEEIVAEGEYTVTIAANSVYLEDCAGEEPVMIDNTGNEKVTLTYTVKKPVVKFELESADPEDGANLTSLSEILTKWTGMKDEGSLKKTCNLSKSAVTVTNEAGDTVTDGSLAIEEDGISVKLSEPIAEKGKFTVTIAANSVYMAEFGEGLPEVVEGTGNDEVKLTYNVDPYVGIAAIDAEEGEIIYLDINGTRVNNPGEGLYIKVKGNKAEKVIRR